MGFQITQVIALFANRASAAHKIRSLLYCLWMEKAFISLADVSEDHSLYVGYDDYLGTSSVASYGCFKIRLINHLLPYSAVRLKAVTRLNIDSAYNHVHIVTFFL